MSSEPGSEPAVHSTVHRLWTLTHYAEYQTAGRPLVVGPATAEQLAGFLVRDDGITLAEARIAVRALFMVTGRVGA